jgi:hypothetical protein
MDPHWLRGRWTPCAHGQANRHAVRHRQDVAKFDERTAGVGCWVQQNRMGGIEGAAAIRLVPCYLRISGCS